MTTPRAAPEGPPPTVAARIGAIESLRAIAAISILAFHAVFASGLAESDSWLKPFASRLEVGVSIFFLISGFLLYRPFVRSYLEGTRAPTLAHYASSRVLRILPGYWFALAVIALWVNLDGVIELPGGLVYFGLLQNYSVDTLGGGLLQAWSLVVEISFYAFLPVFALLMARFPGVDIRERRRNQWLGIGALFAIGIAWNAGVLAVVGINDATSGPLLSSLPAYLDQFALGMGLALLGTVAVEKGNVLTRLGERAWVACLLLAAAIFFLVSKGIGLEGGYEPITSGQQFAKHVMFSAIALLLMAPAALGFGGHGPVSGFFEARRLRWLGLVSYGIFLWHIGVLTQLERWNLNLFADPAANWLGWVLVALVPTAAIAAFSWYAVERPALNARGRLEGLLGRRPPPAPDSRGGRRSTG